MDLIYEIYKISQAGRFFLNQYNVWIQALSRSFSLGRVRVYENVFC